MAAGQTTAEPGTVPRNIILFIGDGVGISYWTAARFAAGALAVSAMRTVALVDTRSSSNRITDSAAAATTFATGVRTYNGAIGVGPDSAVLHTVLEEAEALGRATGLVATSSVTHATPAAFASHVVSRGMASEIARQLARAGLEVLLGGGHQFFDGTARGASDLLPVLRERATVVEDADALAALRYDDIQRLIGLFAEDGMPPAAERSPTLPAMTDAALRVLERDPDGFFLMVEGSQPDWRGHANAPLDEVVAEVLDFDAAIARGLAFQARHPETLIVVVADHETGGLALETDDDGELEADYTSSGHTATMVPLFAAGPGAELFGGIIDNTRVGELLMQAVRGEWR